VSLQTLQHVLWLELAPGHQALPNKQKTPHKAASGACGYAAEPIVLTCIVTW